MSGPTNNDGGIDWRKYSELTPTEKLENLEEHRRRVEERERLARAAQAELDARQPKKEAKS